MVPPRLQLRTGRLAQSARVIDVQATSQGFPSIGYTYDKDPYQVFEASSGTRFSDRERDPRTLIDASIREIAATLFTGRLLIDMIDNYILKNRFKSFCFKFFQASLFEIKVCFITSAYPELTCCLLNVFKKQQFIKTLIGFLNNPIWFFKLL